jgi:hypothetical protein
MKGHRVDIGSTSDWLKANLEVALLDPALKPKVSQYFDRLRNDGRI